MGKHLPGNTAEERQNQEWTWILESLNSVPHGS